MRRWCAGIEIISRIAINCEARLLNVAERAGVSYVDDVNGRVASLHLHPEKAGGRMTDTNEIEVVVAKGIRDEPRYFERTSRSGQPSRRNLTLIEREIVSQHA